MTLFLMRATYQLGRKLDKELQLNAQLKRKTKLKSSQFQRDSEDDFRHCFRSSSPNLSHLQQFCLELSSPTHHTIRTNVVHSSVSITEHYQQQDKLKEVESCLMHLDVTNLDIHQVRFTHLGRLHTTPEELENGDLISL